MRIDFIYLLIFYFTVITLNMIWFNLVVETLIFELEVTGSNLIQSIF